MLTILLIAVTFNGVDSVTMGLVLQDVKTDLHLSDTQLGFLTGLAFALFYSVMGIPIARWADRGNRVKIISITTMLWSAMMALCAVAGSFPQLLLIRVGVAAGEAGCNPPALSLIADYFTRAERPAAVARYGLGWSLSLLLGYFAAGWLNQFYGWRMTFVLMGLPGLGVAALVWFGLKDPRFATPKKREAPGATRTGEMPPNLRQVTRRLWTNRTLRHLLAYSVVQTFFSIAVTQFQAAFLIRSYGLKSGELGTWFAVIYGVSGLLGTYCGGVLASRCAANDEQLQLKSAAVALSSLAISTAFIYLSINHYLAFGLMGLANLMAAMTYGPVYGTLQTLVPPRERATTTALIYLCCGLVGSGLGPLAAGALSDALRPLLGEESLRYALLAFCPGYLWGGWLLWRASKTVARDLEATQKRFDGIALSSLGESTVNELGFSVLPHLGKETIAGVSHE